MLISSEARVVFRCFACINERYKGDWWVWRGISSIESGDGGPGLNELSLYDGNGEIIRSWLYSENSWSCDNNKGNGLISSFASHSLYED